MKTVAAVILVLFLLSASVAGSRMFLRSDTFIIGGEYTIAATETLHGNLKALFAQVKLADGARVDGQITALSSTLDLAGSVSGAVLGVNSDITVRATAQLAEAPRRVAGMPFVILLPGMLHTGHPGALRR
jgi:predicted acyltransferase (DUF342 family)